VVALVMPAAEGTADRLWDLETCEPSPTADAHPRRRTAGGSGGGGSASGQL